mmetsp:Transcript_3529/g.5184  ORF Transcript_3529/g.5184 Transcript_3529/m.5184 type:complete len:138 (-) Transcript_3529:186-599(-)
MISKYSFLSNYMYTTVGTLASIGAYKVTQMYAGKCRHCSTVKTPKMTGDLALEEANAIQRNTLESLPSFLTTLWLHTLTGGSDNVSGVMGGVWAVSRFLYFLGFPNRRDVGFVGAIVSEWILYGLTIYNVIDHLRGY